MSINHDQAIFDAIAAATDHNDDGIFINVQTFIDTFNGHRDRKLCTSIDSYEVTHLKAMLADKHQKTVPVEDRNRIAQTPPDQFMDDYKRDTTNAMAARILELEALLSAAQTPKCARCGSSGDTYVLCSGCGAPAQTPPSED
jgi:hypothetical protein